MKRGFTLLEVFVGLTGGLLLFLGVLSIFSLSRTALHKGGDFAEITQNGRIALERISREFRQAEEIVPPLSQTQSSPSLEIQFLDGHDLAVLTYIRYYITAQSLHRELAYYSLTSAPTVPVHYQDRNPDESPAAKTITEDEIVAEYITALALWESPTSLINISLSLNKDNSATTLTSALYGRNLH
ncbi:MAG: hypothetical protein Q7S48_01650 [bacterium]|nr:hypothetical protein [bacterium]